jgi:hypothetical protein
MNRTGTGQQMLGGIAANSAPLYYPKVYNIEMDPHEDLQLVNYESISVNAFKIIQDYLASVKKFPNPPPANLTNFNQR